MILNNIIVNYKINTLQIDVFLMPTIIKMGQNFVGTNNLNLFQTQGQFGLRLNGGSEERLYGGSDESYLKLLVIIRKRLSCMLIK